MGYPKCGLKRPDAFAKAHKRNIERHELKETYAKPDGVAGHAESDSDDEPSDSGTAILRSTPPPGGSVEMGTLPKGTKCAPGRQVKGLTWFLTYPQCPVSKEQVMDVLWAFRPCKWAVVAEEKHADGSPHLHVVVRFITQLVTRDCNWADGLTYGFHGNYQTARSMRDVLRYVVKDGDFTAKGIDPTKYLKDVAGPRAGHLWDTSAVSLARGETLESINHEEPGWVARNLRKLIEYRDWVRGLKPIHRVGGFDMQCVALHGITGTGKSTFARGLDDVYVLPTPKSGVVWFTGYRGERTLVIDDVTMGNIPIRQLLRILDRHSQRLYVHGATVMADWTRVVICNQEPPLAWYQCGPMLYSALSRRLVQYQVQTRAIRTMTWDEIYECAIMI